MAEIMYPRALGVSEINHYIKEYLSEDDFLSSLAIRGEVSELKPHQSGHVYFTLKEGDSVLKCVMFRRYAAAAPVLPRVGEQAVAIGRVALFERNATCQLYAESLTPDGVGNQARSLEELKQRLQKEGLFAPERKRPLPVWANSVGVVSAANSAAWADIQRIAYARMPMIKLTLYPALVQGEQAPSSIAEALAQADKGGHDVLICGRGGGSGEDLAAFDTEIVVRAVAGTKTPIISAVGHEVDVSLADLAADVRAATPTHAANMAVPDAYAAVARLDILQQRMSDIVKARVKSLHTRLDRLEDSDAMKASASMLNRYYGRMQGVEYRLNNSAMLCLERKKQLLNEQTAQLELLSPMKTLARGYAIVEHKEGSMVRSVTQVSADDELSLLLHDGRVDVYVRSSMLNKKNLAPEDEQVKEGVHGKIEG